MILPALNEAQRRENQAREEARAYRIATSRLFGTEEGLKWLEMARRRWEVDLPVFQRGEGADEARVRDGRREVILEIQTVLDLHEPNQ